MLQVTQILQQEVTQYAYRNTSARPSRMKKEWKEEQAFSRTVDHTVKATKLLM